MRRLPTYGYCIALIALTLFWFGVPICSYAFCLKPKIRVDDEFFVSDIVFVGTIISDQKIGVTSDGFYDSQLFGWRVSKVLRGSIEPGHLVITYSGNDSGRFPFEAEEGHQTGRNFLVFARKYPTRPGAYAVDNCGNSVPSYEAKETLNEIRDLAHRRGGLLYGAMMDRDSNVRIEARGVAGNFTAMTDADGTFQIKLPPGHYDVTATKAGHIYVYTDIAYKRSRDVSVPVGGSAGLSFRDQRH